MAVGQPRRGCPHFRRAPRRRRNTLPNCAATVRLRTTRRFSTPQSLGTRRRGCPTASSLTPRGCARPQMSSIPRPPQYLHGKIRGLRALARCNFRVPVGAEVFRRDVREREFCPVAEHGEEIARHLLVTLCRRRRLRLRLAREPFHEPIARRVVMQRLARSALHNLPDDFLCGLLCKRSGFRESLRALNRKANFPCLRAVGLLGGFLEALAVCIGVAANPEGAAHAGIFEV